MTRSRAALVAVVVAALLLAGCSGTGDTGATPEPTSGSDEARALAADAADAMAAVEEYRVTANVTRVQRHNARRTEMALNSTGAFDRAERAVRVTQRASRRGVTVTETVYLTNASVYRHSEAYEAQYGSAWVRSDLPNGTERVWDRLDTLRRQRLLLENATVSLNGTATVAGTETRVLAVDGNESAFEDLLAARLQQLGDNVSVTVSDVRFTYYVDTETDLPVRTVGVVNSSVTANGQTLHLHEELRLTFSGYGDDVSVTLPENASTAVSLDERTED